MTDEEALCLTIWGECRSEPIEGKLAVAAVIRNRVTTHYGGAQTYQDVCLAKAQFSAWTEEVAQMQAEQGELDGDPSLAHHPDPILRLCLEIARATIAGYLCDLTRGAKFYLTKDLYDRARPVWAKNPSNVVDFGQQVFFDVV